MRNWLFNKFKAAIKGIISPEFYNILISYQNYREDRIKTKQTLANINRLLQNKSQINLELGSNVKRHNFVTIDIGNGADLYWDFLKPIPIADNLVNVIYSSHFLEHFYWDDLVKLLKEIYRILRPGGFFYICVPDARLFIDAYIKNKSLEIIGNNNPYYHYYSPLSYVNYIAYMGKAHKYMFDKEEMISMLKSIGFAIVKERDFEQNMDLEIRNKQSLYVLAIK